MLGLLERDRQTQRERELGDNSVLYRSKKRKYPPTILHSTVLVSWSIAQHHRMCIQTSKTVNSFSNREREGDRDRGLEGEWGGGGSVRKRKSDRQRDWVRCRESQRRDKPDSSYLTPSRPYQSESQVFFFVSFLFFLFYLLLTELLALCLKRIFLNEVESSTKTENRMICKQVICFWHPGNSTEVT